MAQWNTINNSKIQKEYLDKYLFPSITKTSIKNVLNISTNFKQYLVEQGYVENNVEEIVADLTPSIIHRLNQRLEDWERLGLHRPMDITDEEGTTYLTWKHPKYFEYTGRPPLSENYSEVTEWMWEHDKGKFLIVIASYLKLAGASKIFFTDGKGDEGVDLIAALTRGMFRSTYIFIQSKWSADQIVRETVLTEYGKFLVGQKTTMLREYETALGLKNSPDGANICYIIATNNEFLENARTNASQLGILLRSGRQLAHWLSRNTTLQKLKEADDILLDNLRRDLRSNIAELLIL